jgi:hypothetical protein
MQQLLVRFGASIVEWGMGIVKRSTGRGIRRLRWPNDRAQTDASVRCAAQEPATAVDGRPSEAHRSDIRYPQPSSGGDTVNWDAIGAIGQLVGSVAVVVTLGYLAAQVQQTKVVMRRSATASLAEASRMLNQWTASERIARLTVKADAALGGGQVDPAVIALIERAGMEPAEASTLRCHYIAGWSLLVELTGYRDDLSEAERNEADNEIRAFHSSPVQRLIYGALRSTLDARVVEHVDRLLGVPL